MGQFVEFKSQTTNPDIPNVRDVDVEEVRSLKDQVKLVDVRGADEYVGEYGHIAGSELITLDTLMEKMEELPKDVSIVFVCRSGARSARASAVASQFGLEHTYNMKGGMIEWTERQFEAEDKNA